MIDPYSFILGAVYATGFAFISGCLFLYIYRKKKRKIKFTHYYGVYGTRMPHTRRNMMYPSIRRPTPEWLKDLEIHDKHT